MRPSHRASTFKESVIREMSRVAQAHGAINLAQGFPDFAMPEPMKEAACAAIRGDINQYAITWGSAVLRLAIAEKYRRMYDMEVDPEREVTVTCGGTEAMAAAFLALINPGDEVIIPEPFYENYGPDGILAGAKPVFVPLDPPAWTLNPDRLRAAFTPRTRAFVLNTPHNPTGRVFTRDEISLIASLCIEHDVDGAHRRPVRIHHVRGQASPDRHVARNARADGHHLQSVEDIQLHGLAPRLRDRPGRDDERDSEGPRLPDRRRARAAPGRRRGRLCVRRRVFQSSRARLPAPP